MSRHGHWAHCFREVSCQVLLSPLRLRPREKGLLRSIRSKQRGFWVCLAPEPCSPPQSQIMFTQSVAPLPVCLGMRVQRPSRYHTWSLIMGETCDGCLMVSQVLTGLGVLCPVACHLPHPSLAWKLHKARRLCPCPPLVLLRPFCRHHSP